MRLTPSTARNFSRQSELTIEPRKLKELLAGFEIEDDPVKVRYSWAFQLDGIDCAVWEYMGSWRRHEFHLWSAGPMVTLKDFLLSRPELMPHPGAGPMPAVFRSNRSKT